MTIIFLKLKRQNQNTGDEQIDQVIAVGSRRSENRESRNQGQAEIKRNERFPMSGFYPHHQINRQTHYDKEERVLNGYGYEPERSFQGVVKIESAQSAGLKGGEGFSLAEFIDSPKQGQS